VPTSNTATIVKYSAFALVAVLAFIYFRGCGNKGVSVIVTRDTVYRDTGRILTKTDTAYIPKPYYIKGKDSIEIRTEIIAAELESPYLLTDYFASKYYRDTVVNDSSGIVIIKDTLSENRIKGRGVESKMTRTIITETVTISNVLRPRITGYWGASVGGNKSHLLTTVGVNLGVMDRRGHYYGASANLLVNGKPFYGLQYMRPIHLKK
jgi:hypothetical protein